MSRFIHFIALFSLLLSACGPTLTPPPVIVVAPITATPRPTLGQPQGIAPTTTPAPTAMPAPRVVNRQPTKQLVPRQPTIRLLFNRAMDTASVMAALSITPSVPLSLTWPADDTALIGFAAPLQPGGVYTVTLGQTASAFDGHPMASTQTWTYFLEPFTARLSASTQTRALNPLRLHFNYPVTLASLRQAFSITPALSGTLVLDKTGATAIFTPTVLPLSGTTYTVTLAPLLTAEGVRVTAQDPITFTTPPPITRAWPKDNYISPASTVGVAFDRPVNHATAEAAFRLTPAHAGTFEWQGNTLTFKPEGGYLSEFTQYTASLQSAILDEQSQPVLTQPYQWAFDTGQIRDTVTFGYGPNLQVVSANGPRAIQFRAESGASLITFDLYRLSQQQFLNRYATGAHSRMEWDENPLISTTGLVNIHNWQMDVTEAVKGTRDYEAVPQQFTLPTELEPGAYLLNLTAGHLSDQLFVVIAQHALVIKRSNAELLVWASAINGQPTPDMDVTAYHASGQSLGQCRTNAEGVCRIALGEAQPMVVLGQVGDELAMSGFMSGWSGQPNWTTPKTIAANIYTDRPIYRPGQTVYFNAILRQDDDAVLSVPPIGSTVTARLRDARNNLVRTIYLTTDEFGAVSSLFRIAEGAMLGNYAVELVAEGVTHRQVFKVQDYVKPDYAVTLTTNAAQYVAGDVIRATMNASYFFGEPVPNARVTVKQYEMGYDCWDYCGSTWIENYDSDFTGKTDATGNFTFTVDAQLGYYSRYGYWPTSARQGQWGLEVTVDDGSHQTVSSFVSVDVFSADTVLRLNTAGYFQTPDQPFSVNASAHSIFDEPLAGRNLRLQVRRWNSSTYEYSTVVQTQNVTTDENGQGTLPLTIASTGYYKLVLTGYDRRGTVINVESWVYVFGNSSDWTSDSNTTAFSLTADRDTYAPGETATLLVQTSVSGPALLTIERGAVRREQLVTLTAPITRLPITLLPDDAPNVFVSLAAWSQPSRAFNEALDQRSYYRYFASVSESQLLIANIKLLVTPVNKRLTVTLTPNQDVYAPRETATFTVAVTDEAGQPVSAQLSLALVDEAIFTLSDDLSKSLYNSFYAERQKGVSTYNTFAPQRITGGYYCFGECCECGGGGGGEGGMPGGPRSNFQDTAYWQPDIRTDANGVAVVTIVLPDNLTSWRLTAKAITTDTQAGEATLNIITHQEIVVRPLLPRTLTVSDTVMLSAIVANYAEIPQTLIAHITANGLSISGPLTQSITLAPQEQTIIGWQATAIEIGDATIIMSAFSPPIGALPDGGGREGVGDSVKLTLPVQPLAIPNLTTKVGEFTGEFETVLNLPTAALDLSTVKVELSRSIAGSMLTGLEYLTGYPYGCVEQTMSRALPNAVVGRAFHQLGIGNPSSDLPLKINASLQRLYGFQHRDGGWGWWLDDATDDYQTAWVVFGLAVTKEAGYEVDAEVIKRGADYLLERLDMMDSRTRAFALYSLASAGQGDLAATLAQLRHAETLDPFSQAALALALHKLDADGNAQAVLTLLAKTAKVENGFVYWATHQEDGHYHSKTMSSATRSTALALSAFVAIAPHHELESGIVRWLMSQRRAEGWGTTNETSFTLLALTDHLLAKESADGNTQYTVQLNGATIAEGALGKGQAGATLEISAEQMRRGLNFLHLTQSGSGQLYYIVNQRTYIAQAEIPAAGAVQVSRAYLDAKGQPITGMVTAGQLVHVRLIINLPRDGNYLLVEDKLPAGLEALNEALNLTAQTGYVDDYYYGDLDYRWRQLGYNNKEVRGDRVSFFITEMSAGRHTFTYVARATRAGVFAALPTEVYAMYDLTLWGRSASGALMISE